MIFKQVTKNKKIQILLGLLIYKVFGLVRFKSFAIILANAAAAGGRFANDEDLLCMLLTVEALEVTLAFEDFVFRGPTCDVEKIDAVAA